MSREGKKRESIDRDNNSNKQYRTGKIFVTSFVIFEIVLINAVNFLSANEFAFLGVPISFVFPISFYYGRNWARVVFYNGCISCVMLVIMFVIFYLFPNTFDLSRYKFMPALQVILILHMIIYSIWFLNRKSVSVFLDAQREKDFLD